MFFFLRYSGTGTATTMVTEESIVAVFDRKAESLTTSVFANTGVQVGAATNGVKTKSLFANTGPKVGAARDKVSAAFVFANTGLDVGAATDEVSDSLGVVGWSEWICKNRVWPSGSIARLLNHDENIW